MPAACTSMAPRSQMRCYHAWLVVPVLVAATAASVCRGQSITYPTSSDACVEDDVQFAYTECNNSTSPPSILGVPFFDPAICDDAHADSTPLPDFVHAPCDFACESGYAIGSQGVCEACPVGTYSAGDALDIFAGAPSSFSEIEEKGMWTDCKYKSAASYEYDQQCAGWTLHDGVLTAGPYDEVNEFYSFNCLLQPNLTCVNNLRSEMRLDVTLIKDGSVVFDYEVDAERTYDGLSFYVDEQTSSPMLNLTSVTESTQTLEVPLSKGRHTLTWLYSKDNAFTKGKDMAEVKRIVVYGSDKRSKTCVACPKGTSTSAPGSDECSPCGLEQIWSLNSTATGSMARVGHCVNCPDGTHADDARTACVASPSCGTDDMDEVYSACSADGTRTKSFVWKPSLSCIRTPGALPPTVQEACPSCPLGYVQSVDATGAYLRCAPCPSGHYRDEGMDACQVCASGSYALPVDVFDQMVNNGGAASPLLAPYRIHCTSSGATSTEDDCASDPVRYDGSGDIVLNSTVSSAVYLSFNVTMLAGLEAQDRSLELHSARYVPRADVYVDDEYISASRSINDDGVHVNRYTLPSGEGLKRVKMKFSFGSYMFSTSMWGDVSIKKVVIRGAVEGGASTCAPVPAGNVANTTPRETVPGAPKKKNKKKKPTPTQQQPPEGATYYLPCPPGSFNDGSSMVCTPCAEDTFTESRASVHCDRCPAGTTSLAGSIACVVGDVHGATDNSDMEHPMCSFTDPSSGHVYDLSELSVANNETGVFGPVYEAGMGSEAFYVGVCALTNATSVCTDYAGNAIHAAVCRESSYVSYRTNRHVGEGLGRRIAVYPLSEDSALFDEDANAGDDDDDNNDDDDDDFERTAFGKVTGLKMSVSGGQCGYGSSAVPHVSNITFLCDVDAGAGVPSAWDAYTVYSLSIGEVPKRALSLRSPTLPISRGSGKCSHEFLFYSKYACPVCTADDVEEVDVAGCPENVLRTYRLKSTSRCNDINEVVPEDDLCQPCTASDYDRIELEGCPDGRQAKWIPRQPQRCLEVGDPPADPLCPVCAREHYVREEFSAGSCPEGLRARYTLMMPRTCRESIDHPPPEDELCPKCRPGDVEMRSEACMDMAGNSNVTYAWSQPKVCSELREGAYQLPAAVLAGPCAMAPHYSAFSDGKVIAALVVGSLLILVLASLFIRSSLKNRKLYQQYAKLVDDGGVANMEMVDPDHLHNDDDEFPLAG